jgi:hypothetical protein
MRKFILLSLAFAFTASCVEAQGVKHQRLAKNGEATYLKVNGGFQNALVTATEKAAIATPDTGLVVYQTDGTAGLYYYSGSAWLLLAKATSPTLVTPELGVATATSLKTTGNVAIGGTAFATSATKSLHQYTGTNPAASITDGYVQYSADITAGNAAPHFRTEGGDVVKLFNGAALTAGVTSVTHTAPGTPDYAVQNLVQNTGFGFVTADEGNTVLAVILNLQARVNELEDRLQALNLID